MFDSTEFIDAKFEGKLTFVFKMTCGIWEIFTRALLSLKMGTLMGFFCPKLKIFELKIYRGIIHHDNEEWCTTGIGNDLSFQNPDEDFDEF